MADTPKQGQLPLLTPLDRMAFIVRVSPHLPSSAGVALCAIVQRDGRGGCTASYETIGSDAGVSARTIKRGVALLRKAGIVTGGKRGKGSRIRVDYGWKPGSDAIRSGREGKLLKCQNLVLEDQAPDEAQVPPVVPSQVPPVVPLTGLNGERRESLGPATSPKTALLVCPDGQTAKIERDAASAPASSRVSGRDESGAHDADEAWTRKPLPEPVIADYDDTAQWEWACKSAMTRER